MEVGKGLLLTVLVLIVDTSYCLDHTPDATGVIVRSKGGNSSVPESTNRQHLRWASYRPSDSLQQDITDDCRSMLNDFSAAASQFMSCVLDNGRPLHYCEMCYQQYTNVTSMYEKIDTDTNKPSGSNCSAYILQGDYVQIVSVSYQQVLDVWLKSQCDQCFNITDGVYIVKNDTRDMMKKIDDTLDCFSDFPVTSRTSNNSDNDLCTYCHNVYFDANDFYRKIKKKNGLCSDLVDAMNHTRLTWGNSTNRCSLAIKDSGEIWGITAIMLVLPIFLYLGAWLHTKYVLNDLSTQEGMQEPLLETPG